MANSTDSRRWKTENKRLDATTRHTAPFLEGKNPLTGPWMQRCVPRSIGSQNDELPATWLRRWDTRSPRRRDDAASTDRDPQVGMSSRTRGR